jgi:DNA-binding MarR family transcriptional regulator
VTQTSNAVTESSDAPQPDPLQVVEREFGTFMMNFIRYKAQVNGDRLDRMALMVLGTLAHCGPARLTTVADKTGFDPSTVSRQVADLEKAGLLARDIDPDDRRAILLEATHDGQALLKKLAVGRRERMTRLLADWESDDIATFGRLLGQFNESTEKYGAQIAHEMDQELNNG